MKTKLFSIVLLSTLVLSCVAGFSAFFIIALCAFGLAEFAFAKMDESTDEPKILTTLAWISVLTIAICIITLLITFHWFSAITIIALFIYDIYRWLTGDITLK